jgi:hypothetical protein
MAQQKTIEVDIDDAIGASMEADEAGVQFDVVQANGPGGGNPLVRLTGDEDKVNALLETWGYSPEGGTMDDDEDDSVTADVPCPGCGCLPCDGLTPGCKHPEGCGYFIE